jgi:hypothetical protein
MLAVPAAPHFAVAPQGEMHMLRRISWGALFLSLACGPSINPAAQASVDRQVASMQQQSKTFPAPATEMPPPLSVGQWIRLKMLDSSGRPSLITYKIVGQEGSAYWVESVTESYTGKTILKMLVDFGDRTDLEKIDIQNVIVKNGDRAPVDYSKQGPVLSIVKGTYKSVVKNLIVKWHGLPKETRTTIAGTFTDCYRGVSDVSLGPVSRSGTVWYHPAVPINGAVAFKGDQGDAEELVAFGETGAVSEL